MLIELLCVLVTIAVLVYLYIKRALGYWASKGVPTVKPEFPFGTNGNPITRDNSIGVHIKNIYDELKSQGHKHGGLYSFTRPAYMPMNPNVIKNILQTDFNHFVERGFYYNEKDDPLSANLFAIGGHKWRNLRTKLTPTFTSGKMKMMFETLVVCGDQMIEAMDNYHTTKEPVDIKDVLARFTTDIIGSCAFGLECNSFKSPDADFRRYGKRIFDRSKLENLQIATVLSFPSFSRAIGLPFFPKEATEFFMNVVKSTVKYRESNDVTRKDMLQLLLDIKNQTKEDRHDGSSLTIEEHAAQAFVFFIAGYETSSTTMTFCLYELAKHPEIQEKLREEVNQVLEKHDGKITYDAIMDMKYMNQVIDETLRKYPPLPFITRSCVKDYKIAGTDLVIENGTDVLIPILGLHHDEEYYPEPEKFDPERFSDKNKQKIHQFTFIPFGEGPRICIGLRFGLMQTKVGLSLLLRNYKLSLSEKTVDPFSMDRFSFILTSETGIYLDVDKIN